MIAIPDGDFVFTPNPFFVVLPMACMIGALITAAKGRFGWLLVGLCLGGLIWPLTACLIATPDSLWARVFYRPSKMARARGRFPRRLPHT